MFQVRNVSVFTDEQWREIWSLKDVGVLSESCPSPVYGVYTDSVIGTVWNFHIVQPDKCPQYLKDYAAQQA